MATALCQVTFDHQQKDADYVQKMYQEAKDRIGSQVYSSVTGQHKKVIEAVFQKGNVFLRVKF